MFGKKVNELQTDIKISGTEITGTLNHITGYTLFSSEPDEQTGNYLALKVEPTPSDSKITVEIINGTKGPVVLDGDKNIVLLIKNKDTQKVKVTVEKDKKTATVTYGLKGLTLKTE